jgi:hypothetical protein
VFTTAQTSGVPDGYDTAEVTMLSTIAIVLLVLWLLGYSRHTMGGFIHILVVVAVVMVLVRIIQGRNPLGG